MNPTPNKSFFSAAAKNRHAFTLIELLTVIAIIGILAAIIIPVTTRVRESAKQASCLTNMRQIGVANALYTADNKGQLNWQGDNQLENKWGTHIQPYMVTNTPSAKDNYFTCPSRYKTDSSGNVALGTDYSMNAETCVSSGSGADIKYSGVNISKYGDLLSKKVYLLDSQSGGVTKTNAFYRLPAGRDPVTDMSGGYLTWRHSGKCNLLFLDGHVATLGFPPLPIAADNNLGRAWMSPGVAAPDL